jgi:hypothetical protein
MKFYVAVLEYVHFVRSGPRRLPRSFRPGRTPDIKARLTWAKFHRYSLLWPILYPPLIYNLRVVYWFVS